MILRTNILIVFTLSCFTQAFAQTTTPSSVDTGKKITIILDGPIKKSYPVYVFDGKRISEKTLENTDRNTIFNMLVLRPTEAIAKYGTEAKDGAIVIVSKKFAVKTYQDKLSSLSKEYKQYLKKNHSDDKLLFIINGVEYPTSSQERIDKLYNLFSDNVAFSSFELIYVTGIDTIPSSVNINTKTI